MNVARFPFPALVGLDELKMGLQLAAIDFRLSVLVRGDKGTGKSTAARGLADLLDGAAPFVNLPIGTTDDRLLGGLDLEKALRGLPALKPGLLADADGGVLYVDEVNLLPDHLADALLDAVASGVHIVEREGFSATQPARFVLVGSMNPEEGSLRPQLLDRFALAVDVSAPMDARIRRDAVQRRLSYDADPTRFIDAWDEERARLTARIHDARLRLPDVMLPAEMLDLISARIVERDVRSLRADLAAVRASRALAALEGAGAVDTPHVEAVLPLVFSHRSTPPDRDRPRQAPRDAPHTAEDEGEHRADGAAEERVFAPSQVRTPVLNVENSGLQSGRSPQSGIAPGVVIGVRQTPTPGELDTRATMLHVVTRGSSAEIAEGDLHERLRAPRGRTRFIFVVDSSGSHAVHERMRAVKGTVKGLLDTGRRRRDEVVVIACRGASASVVVEPTSVLADADRVLEYLPTGGRTPLAHALELAAGYVTDSAAVIVLTDGHANVPSRTGDPWADTLTAARAIRCAALVVDSEDERRATGRPKMLAEAMGGRCVRLVDLEGLSVLDLVRETS